MSDLPMIQSKMISQVRQPVTSDLGTPDSWGKLAQATSHIADEFQKDEALAHAAKLAHLENSMKRQFAELDVQYGDDPKILDSKMEEYSAQHVANTPVEEQPDIIAMLDKQRADLYTKSLYRKRDRDRAQNIDTINAKEKEGQETIKRLSGQGKMTEDLNRAMNDHINLIQTKVNTGIISQEMADMQIEQLKKDTKKEVFIGHAKSSYDLGRSSSPKTQDDIIRFVIGIEGGDKIAQEPKGAIAKFGINSNANPNIDVASLTQDQAFGIYKRDYWDKANIGSLPEDMRMVAFDTVVNHGVEKGSALIKAANGSVDQLLSLRGQEYTRLVGEDPATYGQYKSGWDSRLSTLRGASGDPEHMKDFGDLLANVKEFMPELSDTEAVGLQQRILTDIKTQEEVRKSTLTLQQADLQRRQEVNRSNLELEITKTEDPMALMGLLEKVNSSSDEEYGDVLKRNDLAEKIYSKTRETRMRHESAVKGSAFALGAAYLNPENKEAVKNYNDYYDLVVTKGMDGMGTAERNTLLANLVDTARVVPDTLKGDLLAASKSRNTQEVMNAADLMNKIAAINPQMLNDIPEKSRLRLDLVNSYLNSGISEEDAFKKVDETLSPLNETIIKRRKETLSQKDSRPDYMKLAVDAIEPWYGGLNGDNPATTRMESDRMAADYQRVYDNTYIATGDEDLAKKYANRYMTGTYSITSINGKKEAMKYAPETAYSIPKLDNGWMREQMLADARTAMNGTWTDGEFNEDSIIIVPDPYATPKSFKEGRPIYKLMMIGKDGDPIDILGKGKYWAPDPHIKRNQILSESKGGK